MTLDGDIILMLLSVKILTTEQLDNSNDFLIAHNSSKIPILHAVPVVYLRKGMPQEEHKSGLTTTLSTEIVYLGVFFLAIISILNILSSGSIRDILQHLCGRAYGSWVI